MLSIRPSRYRKLRLILTLSCIILLGAGVYILLLVFSPAIKQITVDPNNNATIKKLQVDSPKELWLYIPKIDVNVPIAQGESALQKGAWWRQPQNGNPEDGGNFVLAGHRFVMDFKLGGTNAQSPFYNIDKLHVGDKIIIDYHNKRYGYIIKKTFSVKPTDIQIEARSDTPQLTIYTCTLSGSSDGRNVIIATPFQP